MSGVRVPSLTPLKVQVRRSGRTNGRASRSFMSDFGSQLGADLDCRDPTMEHSRGGEARPLLRLIKLKLTDFRRFDGEQSLDLNESLIALVGPNEAGKSSILTAIGSVGRKEAPSPTDTTRGRAGPAIIAALFALDPDDKAAIAEIHGGGAVARAWITRTAGTDKWTCGLQPHPQRDRAPRMRCLRLVTELKDSAAIGPMAYQAAIGGLASSDETLPEETIATLQTLGDMFYDTEAYDPELKRLTDHDLALKSLLTGLGTALRDLSEFERRPTPWRQFVDILKDRIPEVAFFGAPDRELQSSYQLDEVATNPPSALRNLCALAELDLAEVQKALTEDNSGRAERLFEIANAKLKVKFRNTWRQSSVYPRLSAPLDKVLRVFVATEDGEYTFPEVRSDGLRWFMALHAFLAARGQHEPILLIDEAETHLHYDAQADLIDALMSQRIARQVIYTRIPSDAFPLILGAEFAYCLARRMRNIVES
jgi:hypothetical protein